MRTTSGNFDFGLDESIMCAQMSSLAGNEKVKVLLAQALFGNPDIILMDEPTNHLDVDAKEELARALKAYKGSILLICHEPEFYEGFATRVVDCSEFCLRG